MSLEPFGRVLVVVCVYVAIGLSVSSVCVYVGAVCKHICGGLV